MLQDCITQVLPLPGDALSALMGCVTWHQLKKGSVVLNEGEVCQALYFVEKGYLRTYYNKDGATINLNFTFEGDFTSNLLSFKTRTASELVIEAGEPAEIWVLDINQLRPYFKLYPDLEKFAKRLALRLLLASEAYSNLFKISTPTERYKYVEQNNPRLLQRIPLSQMASYLGVSRETISRIRGREIL